MANENKMWFRFASGHAAQGAIGSLYALVFNDDGEVCNNIGENFQPCPVPDRDVFGLAPTEIDTGDDESWYYWTNIGDILATVNYRLAIYQTVGLLPQAGDTPVGNGTLGPDLSAGAIVDGKTLAEALQIIAAVVAGKITTAGTGVETFKGLDGSTSRAVVTVDSTGNRSAVSYP